MSHRVKAKFAVPAVVHKLGHCNDCDSQFDLFSGEEEEMKNHILQTGHSVTVETGTYNIFYLQK